MLKTHNAKDDQYNLHIKRISYAVMLSTLAVILVRFALSVSAGHNGAVDVLLLLLVWAGFAKALALVHRRPNGLHSGSISGGWQPINTAPKDGTIIAYMSNHRVLGACHWYSAPNEGCIDCWWDVDDDDETIPTHWRQLPTPPNKSQVGGEQ